MKLIGRKGDFTVYFSAMNKKYFVYEGNKLLITKYKFSDVKCYLD